MKKTPQNQRGDRARAAHRDATRCCRNLYRFIRSRLGDEISDREIARRWGMEWKSFAALKHGRRQVPRLRQLETLANLLGVDASVVFQVAVGGEPTAAVAPEGLPAIFDGLPAACIVLDGERTIVAANSALARVCSSTAAEAIGRSADEVFGPPGPSCPIARAFQTGRVEHQVTWRLNRSGQRVYVHRVVGPVRERGRITRVIELVVDVSATADGERRRAPRVEADFHAQLRHGEATERVHVENLGPEGLFVRTPAKIPKGAEIEIEWMLPNDGVPVRARAVVAWLRTAHKGRQAGLGLRVLELAPGTAQLVSM